MVIFNKEDCKMKIKKTAAAVLALLMLLGCFTGCGKEKEEASELAVTPSIISDATGRYVEKSIPLPEAKYAVDMVKLSDGRLRVALQGENGSILLCTSGPDRASWVETISLPSEILNSGSVESVSLSPDGTVFCDTVETLANGTYQPHLWVMDPSGQWRELPVTYPDVDPEMGFFIAYCDFTEDGRLIAQFYVTELREIDLTTGQVGKNLNELEATLFRTGCAGQSAYMMSMETASFHQNGETKPLPDVLKAQIEGALKEDFGNTPKITFWENPDGYLFFTTYAGLYSYIPGGSVTEEVVGGTRTSLGDPTCNPVALTGMEDGSFYLLCNLNGEPTLCHFTYDEEAPLTADTQLTIYSLYPDDDLTQMIVQFQKANPDITVEHEVGLSGDSGITEADAARTLNTEILAGNGPDLICLDGFNLESYLEKGVLADVSHILAQGDPLLRNITDCYGEDGKICAVPTTFTFPAIYGKEEYVSQIHDLDSLVAVAKQARAEYPAEKRVVNGMYPDVMVDYFYDSCSAAWMNPDGTLDAEKLTHFYAAVTELYALDEVFRQANEEWMTMVREEYVNGENQILSGQYTGIIGAHSIISDISYLSFGTLDGMYCYAHVLAGEAEYLGDGYITSPLDGQASNVFLPRRIMGILTTAQHPQAAEQFLSFMLSDEVQAKDLTTGFPVNKVTFDREMSEERVIDSWIGNGSIGYQAQWPNAAQREELRGWVSNLTTPANTNRTIRYMVMEPLWDCCNGILTPEEAAQAALQSLNLYLSE